MRKMSSKANGVRWLRTGSAALAIATLAGWVVALTGTPASAARAGELCTSSRPPAGCHFIQVTDKGASGYTVKATLHGHTGNVVYHWSDSPRWGGDLVWWYIAVNSRGWLDVSINNDESGIKGGTLDRDYCFHIDTEGFSHYTGDSKTGHCILG